MVEKHEGDLENVRIELVDILHALVSAMSAAGLTPETVFKAYCDKHTVNLSHRNAQE